MNVIAEIQRINEKELEKGIVYSAASWHTKYSESAWVFAGNLPPELTEGDLICVMSQYGEVEDINLARDASSGKSRGFAFVKYEDARSCVLAVDNLGGTQLLGRMLRVDHVEKYRLPKEPRKDSDESVLGLKERAPEDDVDGCGQSDFTGYSYKGKKLASSYNIHNGVDLFSPTTEIGFKVEENSDKHDVSQLRAKQLRKEARAKKRKEKEKYKLRKEERRRKREVRQKSSRREH